MSGVLASIVERCKLSSRAAILTGVDRKSRTVAPNSLAKRLFVLILTSKKMFTCCWYWLLTLVSDTPGASRAFCYETCIHSRSSFFCQFVATDFFALSCMSLRNCHKTVLNIKQFVYCLTPWSTAKGCRVTLVGLSTDFRPHMSFRSVRSLCAFNKTFLLARQLDGASRFVNSGLEYV